VTGRPITHCALVFPQQLGRDRSTAGTFFGADHALFLHHSVSASALLFATATKAVSGSAAGLAKRALCSGR
jgi:hypothetical protein